MKDIRLYFTQEILWKTVFLSLFIISIIVRIFVSQSTGIWIDEVADLNTSREVNFIHLLLGQHGDSAHPPLFFMINRILTVFSEDIYNLRLISIFVSSVGLWKLMKWLQGELNSDILSTFTFMLLGFSYAFVPIHLLSQSYAWTFTLIMFSIVYSFKYIYHDGCQKNVFILGSLYFLTFFMDYSAMWFLISLAIFLIYLYVFKKIGKDKLLFFAKTFGVSIGFFLLWSPVFFKELGRALKMESFLAHAGYLGFKESLWIEQETYYGITSSFWLPLLTWIHEFTFINESFVERIADKLGVNDITICILLIVLSFIGIFYIIKRNHNLGLFLLISFLFPIGLSHGYSLLSGNVIFQPRNLWFSWLPIILGYMGFAGLLFHGVERQLNLASFWGRRQLKTATFQRRPYGDLGEKCLFPFIFIRFSLKNPRCHLGRILDFSTLRLANLKKIRPLLLNGNFQTPLRILAFIFIFALIGSYAFDFPNISHTRNESNIGGLEKAMHILKTIDHKEKNSQPEILLLSNHSSFKLVNIEYFMRRRGYQSQIVSLITLNPPEGPLNQLVGKELNRRDADGAFLKRKYFLSELQGKHIYLLNMRFLSDKEKFNMGLRNWASKLNCRVEILEPIPELPFVIKCHLQ